MTPVATLRRPTERVTCRSCGVLLAKPDWSENFSEEQVVLNFWSCTACGHQFETEVALAGKVRNDSAVQKEAVRAVLVA